MSKQAIAILFIDATQFTDKKPKGHLLVHPFLSNIHILWNTIWLKDDIVPDCIQIA